MKVVENINDLRLQVITLAISQANQRIEQTITTKTEHKRVKGFMISNSTRFNNPLPQGAYSTFGVAIGTEEIIPRETPVSLFSEKQALSVEENIWPIDAPANGSTLKIDYQDVVNGALAFAPYQIKIILFCEKK